MSEPIARYYDARKNPGTEAYPSVLPFVGLRDITEAEYAALAAWQQESIDACVFYAKSKPRAPKADDAPAAPDRTPKEG